MRAVSVFAKLASDDAFDFIVVAVDQLGTGHAGENFNAELFCLFGHPAADVAHGDDIAGMVVHQRRHHDIWNADFAGFAQHIKVVLFHRHGDWCTFGFPVGDQRVDAGGVQNCAR